MKKKKATRKCTDRSPEECYNCKDEIKKKKAKQLKKTKESTPIILSIKATPAEAKYLRDLRRWEREGKN